MTKYSWLIGLKKTIKNALIMFGPTAVVMLLGIQGRYAWLAGGVAYMIKNYISNRK